MVNGNLVEEFIKEQSEKVRKEIETKFKYEEESPQEYERVLRRELEEFIHSHFDPIEMEYEDFGQSHKKGFYKGEIINNSEFRKAVIEAVFPLALEHTEAFKIDTKDNRVVNNIKRILEYSPGSIDIVIPIIEQLDEVSLESILEGYPELKTDILEKIKESRESKDTEKLRLRQLREDLKRRFKELGIYREDVSTQDGKHTEMDKKAMDLLRDCMGFLDRCEALEQENSRETRSNEDVDRGED